jgi:hypothetical protein
MRVQTIIDIFDYWNRIRGLEVAPLRSQVEPTALRRILSSVFILESTEEGRVAFRLAGTRICDLFGRDLRGAHFSDLWAKGQHDDIDKTAAGVMEHVIPALLTATGYSTAGHRASFEIIMMPLRSKEGNCDRMLGAIAPATTTSWLEAVPVEFLALDRSRLLHETLAGPGLSAEEGIVQNGVAAGRPHGLAETMRRMMSHLFENTSAH